MSTLTPPLTDTEAAAYLRVSRKTLADWRYRGIGPAYAKAGRWVRYRLLANCWDTVEVTADSDWGTWRSVDGLQQCRVRVG